MEQCDKTAEFNGSGVIFSLRCCLPKGHLGFCHVHLTDAERAMETTYNHGVKVTQQNAQTLNQSV